MPYLYLAIAIGFELASTTMLKLSEGFTKMGPAISSLALYAVCFYFFSKSLRSIDLGVAYATWCSAGIVTTSLIAALAFGEKLNAIGIVCLVLITAGCIVLNLYGTAK